MRPLVGGGSVALAILLASCASAPAPVPSRRAPRAVASTLHQALADIRSQAGLPALVVGIVPLTGDWSLDVQGERVAGGGNPVAINDLFHLGSSAKPMTADLAAMAVAQGEVLWDAPVRSLIPELLPPDGGSFANVTLRQALAHEAGFPRFDELSDAEWDRLRSLPGSPTAQRATVLRELLAGPAAGPAGERAYSNVGYLLAGYVVERRAGGSFEALRRERLLLPLGMGACRVGWPAAAPDGSAPWGHYPGAEGKPSAAARQQPVAGAFVGPGGDLSCPPAAIAAYLLWHLRAIATEPQEPALPEVAQLHGLAPAGASPLGWGRSLRDDGTEMQAVMGSLELFTALLAIDVTHRVGYFALTNVGESPTVKAALVEALKAAQRPP